MAYYHPLWGPPTPEDLKNGAAALAKAKDVEKASQREKDFIAALEVFYKDAETVPHAERAKAFEKAMGELAGKYPDDVEAQAFHALMLVAVAPPGDQTFANQKAAGEVLEKLHYDFYYIKNFSFWLDLLILAGTIRVIFTGFGVR